MPIPPINPLGQIITNPAQAQMMMQELSAPAQQENAALSMVVTNQMLQQYSAAHQPQRQSGPAHTQWPQSQPPQEQTPPRVAGLPPKDPGFRMLPVKSSTINMVGYNPKAGQLHIQFRSSPETYVYSGVDTGTYGKFMSAPSKGAAHASIFKGNPKFPFTKQKPVPPQL